MKDFGWIDVVGWIGSIEVILAYALNSYQKIKSDGKLFLVLNITGGVGLIIYSYYHDALANTFINVVWVIIAVPALLKVLRRTKQL